MPPRFVRSHRSLITTPEATRRGFLDQALTKTEVAESFIEDADALVEALDAAESIDEVIANRRIREHLIAASGFSEKASGYITPRELNRSLGTVLRQICEECEEAGADWRSNIVYRFLLTKGDAMGGIMRNKTGAVANTKFAQAVFDTLGANGVVYRTTRARGRTGKVQQIGWNDREIFFDKKPGFIGNSVDVILLRHRPGAISVRLNREADYLACGEIKGGIDPAGADEHWKTAATALQRIRDRCQHNLPELFFVGSAIEESMAKEIFAQLESGELTHAANFNEQRQLEDLVNWLIDL